jgi:peptidoglycan/xylan/chitin deacetylase (PgdA/CDA1 family)
LARRLAWKRRIGRLYALLRARDEQRRIVLLYHSIGGGAEATATEAFRGHLDVLAATVRLVDLRDMLAGATGPGLAVAITFDDGYATLRDQAAPVLADFGAAATAFLNVGEIADDERRRSSAEAGYYPDERFLSWRDVDALREARWQFGSHGVHHLDLTRADAATAERELGASKSVLEQRLGAACDMFAYPWGRNNGSLRNRTRAAGYRYAFAGGHHALTSGSDPLALPRINVANDYSLDDFAAILRGDWDYLHWLARAKAGMRP